MPFTVDSMLDRLEAAGVCSDTPLRRKALEADLAGRGAYAYTTGHHNQIVTNAAYTANEHGLWIALGHVTRLHHPTTDALRVLDSLVPLNRMAVEAMASQYHWNLREHRYSGKTLEQTARALVQRRRDIYRTAHEKFMRRHAQVTQEMATW